MMTGVAFSRGLVSMRVTPSIGTGISSSAGSDMRAVLLYGLSQKWCKRRDFVGGTLDADHGGAVDRQRTAHGGGQPVEVTDVDGCQPGEHGRQAGPQPAGAEPVVAVQVVVEQLLASHAHGVGVVVEQH